MDPAELPHLKRTAGAVPIGDGMAPGRFHAADRGRAERRRVPSSSRTGGGRIPRTGSTGRRSRTADAGHRSPAGPTRTAPPPPGGLPGGHWPGGRCLPILRRARRRNDSRPQPKCRHERIRHCILPRPFVGAGLALPGADWQSNTGRGKPSAPTYAATLRDSTRVSASARIAHRCYPSAGRKTPVRTGSSPSPRGSRAARRRPRSPGGRDSTSPSAAARSFERDAQLDLLPGDRPVPGLRTTSPGPGARSTRGTRGDGEARGPGPAAASARRWAGASPVRRRARAGSRTGNVPSASRVSSRRARHVHGHALGQEPRRPARAACWRWRW